MVRAVLYWNQFDNEPIEQIPDPHKKYYLNRYASSVGFTYLFKLLCLIDTYPELIDKISEHTKDINVHVDDWNALHFVCCNYKSDKLYKVIKLLIKAGADFNHKNNYGQTPLQLVCWLHTSDKLYKIIRLLVKKGADVNSCNMNGETILQSICHNHKSVELSRIVQLLLDAGANPDFKNNFNYNALRYICRYYLHYNSKQLLKTIKILIKFGVDLYSVSTSVAELNNPKIHDIIITYHKQNSHIIQPLIAYFNEDQIKLLDWFKKFKTSIDPIKTLHNEFYYYPHNIGALLCESNFSSKSNNQYYSHKSAFLFSP